MSQCSWRISVDEMWCETCGQRSTAFTLMPPCLRRPEPMEQVRACLKNGSPFTYTSLRFAPQNVYNVSKPEWIVQDLRWTATILVTLSHIHKSSSSELEFGTMCRTLSDVLSIRARNL